MDTTCDESPKLFKIYSTLNFFNASYNWLMLSIDFNTSFNLLKHQNINLDAEITLAVADKNESNFVFYDVYNPSFKYGGRLVITEKGNYSNENGFKINLRGTKLENRRNLQGIEINVGVVATGIKNHETLIEYLESDDNPSIDAQHRHHYRLHKILSSKYNYSMFLHRASSWGFLRNGSYDVGVMKMFNYSQIDFSIAAFRFTIDRSYLVDYTITTWLLYPVLLFRHPRNSLRNPFFEPFSPSIWYIILIFIFIMSCLITLTMKCDNVKKITFIRACMNAIGIICQQGFMEDLYKSSVRFLLIVFIMFSSIIYQFYNSYIVGSLLTDPPKTINNLRQLIDSEMDIGIEDVTYNRDFLETSLDKTVVEFYHKRVLHGNSKGNYLTAECGIEKMHKGNFAFQVDTAYAYRLIEDSFTDDEICELHHIILFPKRPLSVVVAKRSPFREMIMVEFLKFTENGIIQYYDTKWQRKRPKCNRSVVKIKAIDSSDTSWFNTVIHSAKMFLIKMFENSISFLFLCALMKISISSRITCEAPLQSTCMVIDSERINGSDAKIEIIGAEVGNPQIYAAVTGFYAISKGLNIKFVPSNLFKNFPNLQYFYMHDVQLEELQTDAFKKCSKLQQIVLTQNSIKSLPQSFAMGCSQAYLLDVSYNQLKELNSNSFKGLTSLVTLNMNYNFIEVIAKGTFDVMPSLTLISMNMNKISFIHPNAFHNLPSLSSLVLSNNNIKVIKSGWFENKTYFGRLNLKNNEIAAIDSNIFNIWLVTNSNDTKAKISYEMNLEGNICVNMEMKQISKKTTPYFKNILNRCFIEYESNYFYKNFP